MRFVVSLILLFTFASCATTRSTQRWPNIDATYRCEAMTCPSPEDTEDAAAAFVLAWYSYFGSVCELDGLDVSWEPLVAEGVLGRYTWQLDLIQARVGAQHPDRVADTSFGHEMVHRCLGQTKGDIDDNHEQDPGPWTIQVQIFLDLFEEYLRRRDTTDL